MFCENQQQEWNDKCNTVNRVETNKLTKTAVNIIQPFCFYAKPVIKCNENRNKAGAKNKEPFIRTFKEILDIAEDKIHNCNEREDTQLLVKEAFILAIKSVSIIFTASAIMFLNAFACEIPWPMITGLETPSTGVPP